MRPRWLLLAGSGFLAALGGCLTESLDRWYRNRTERSPELVRTAVPCEIDEARGAVLDAERRRLVVAFTPSAGSPTPSHLHKLATRGPVRLRIRPRGGYQGTSPWHAADPRVQVDAWELGVFDGRHLHRATLNARVTLHGRVAPGAVGSILGDGDVLGGAAGPDGAGGIDDTPTFGWIDQCLRGFAAHRWLELLGGPDVGHLEHRQVPVAWLGPDGETVSTRQIDELLFDGVRDPRSPRLAEFGLLGRVDLADGTSHFVRVPLPVLLRAEQLRFERHGSEIRFEMDERWTGRLAAHDPNLDHAAPSDRTGVDATTTEHSSADLSASDRTAVDLPMLESVLVYHWTDEVPPATLFAEIVHKTLTPITVIVDFILATSPFAPLRKLLIEERDVDVPRRGRGR